MFNKIYKPKSRTCWFAWDWCYCKTSVSSEIWQVISSEIINLQIMNMAISHWNEITYVLYNYYISSPGYTAPVPAWPMWDLFHVVVLP